MLKRDAKALEYSFFEIDEVSSQGQDQLLACTRFQEVSKVFQGQHSRGVSDFALEASWVDDTYGFSLAGDCAFGYQKKNRHGGEDDVAARPCFQRWASTSTVGGLHVSHNLENHG